MAPLANPYVPYQMDDPPQYQPEKALIRGTLFPGLDLPFFGMVNKTEKPRNPKTELQVMAFVIQELALYLDTHREDREALELYREYQKLYDHCRSEYLKKHGPMNHSQVTEGGKYQWLDDPWPWEYCKNKEV
jgi:spore coat protein JB